MRARTQGGSLKRKRKLKGWGPILSWLFAWRFMCRCCVKMATESEGESTDESAAAHRTTQYAQIPSAREEEIRSKAVLVPWVAGSLDQSLRNSAPVVKRQQSAVDEQEGGCLNYANLSLKRQPAISSSQAA